MRRALDRARSRWAWVVAILVERVESVFSNDDVEESWPYWTSIVWLATSWGYRRWQRYDMLLFYGRFDIPSKARVIP